MIGLNYHHLMYFRTIATEGSISKASQRLRVGQPALSSQLKQLEEYFGENLFERRNRSLILTEVGQVALEYANQIHSLGLELVDSMHSHGSSQKIHLSLAAIDSIPKNLIIHLMESVQKYRECSITALDGTGDELYRQLISHQVDVVVSDYHFTPGADRRVFSKTLGKFKLGVYGAESYLSLKKGFPQSLEGQPMILSTTHSKLRHDIEHFFESNDMPLNVLMSTQDTSIQKILAVDGQGLIVEPEFAVKELIDEGKLFKIGYLPGVFVDYFLNSTKKLVRNPILEYLMEGYLFKRPKSEKF